MDLSLNMLMVVNTLYVDCEWLCMARSNLLVHGLINSLMLLLGMYLAFTSNYFFFVPHSSISIIVGIVYVDDIITGPVNECSKSTG
jgi:hypothetical protein